MSSFHGLAPAGSASYVWQGDKASETRGNRERRAALTALFSVFTSSSRRLGASPRCILVAANYLQEWIQRASTLERTRSYMFGRRRICVLNATIVAIARATRQGIASPASVAVAVTLFVRVQLDRRRPSGLIWRRPRELQRL